MADDAMDRHTMATHALESGTCPPLSCERGPAHFALDSGIGQALAKRYRTPIGSYCAVQKIGDSPPGTAQSGGESEEGRRPAPLGRARGEGRALAAHPVQWRGPSPRTKQRERMCSQNSALLSKPLIYRMDDSNSCGSVRHVDEACSHRRRRGIRVVRTASFHVPNCARLCNSPKVKPVCRRINRLRAKRCPVPFCSQGTIPAETD
jgi:hypothetical protein